MKTIGLLGGMSWKSTSHYYQLINQQTRATLGGLHSAKICLHSVDFAEIEVLQRQGNWQQAAELLSQLAKQVEAGGADCLLICTNTMHKVAEQVQAAIKIPLLHIADATAQALLADGITRVGLLGTRFTMEQDFYKQRLVDKHGIEVLVPGASDQTVIHDVIFEELCRGEVKQTSRDSYLVIINKLLEQGAQAIILGCTEIGLLVQAQHTTAMLYDTSVIHAQAAVDFALQAELAEGDRDNGSK
ncbi:aspartate/glutamate racemase family protein [Vibrio sp. CAU 1672]|uniref:aspartate/glutamate racemase family protein n=1 Tax=Vibrio sp. CAU 1672 TaxID=3032594 RepID=UPI0023DC0687|nr:aspartate/glutamate racemase family protein [Vibrio sp. CAU 1672]MDF2153408.1 aspartate/glutamate racemase family protein [Vibrio sp. CAU 1672]